MKKSELRQLVLEAIQGYSKYAQEGATKGGKTYSKDDAIAYIENNRAAKYYNIGVGQGVSQRATDPVKAIEIVGDSPISQFELTTYGDVIQFSAPYDEKHGDAVRAMGGLD